MTRDARARLDDAAVALLDERGPAFRWAEAARDLGELLAEIGGAEVRDAPDVPTQLAAGIALSPTSAASCLQDFARTARFAQGLAAAVRDAAARGVAPVEVVYAGCGPFALLCLPMLARGAPARVTLVDVHAAALARARLVLGACGLAERVAGYVCADATTYRHPRPVDVAVSETMGQALEKEPQVAVMAALGRQLGPGGVLVPERIRVEACLADAAREFAEESGPERPRIVLGGVLDVSAASASRVLAGGAPVVLTVPALSPGDPAVLMLRTTVVVHGRIALGEYDSGITYPKFVHALGRLAPGQVVEVAYRTGASPRFECRLARPDPV